MLAIPFNQASNFKEQLLLDGELFVLEFTWNALNEFWVMDIYTREEDPILLGIKIVPNYPLLSAYSMPEKPKGEIICQNVVSDTGEIERFDIGQKFELIYYSQNEFEALAVGI